MVLAGRQNTTHAANTELSIPLGKAKLVHLTVPQTKQETRGHGILAGSIQSVLHPVERLKIQPPLSNEDLARLTSGLKANRQTPNHRRRLRLATPSDSDREPPVLSASEQDLQCTGSALHRLGGLSLEGNGPGRLQQVGHLEESIR